MDHPEPSVLGIVGKEERIPYNGKMENDGKQETDLQQERIDQLRARVHAAKIAYLNRAPFEGKTELTYEDLKKIAQEFITASYEVQKQRYGSVKVRISVAKLLRQR